MLSYIFYTALVVTFPFLLHEIFQVRQAAFQISGIFFVSTVYSLPLAYRVLQEQTVCNTIQHSPMAKVIGNDITLWKQALVSSWTYVETPNSLLLFSISGLLSFHYCVSA